MVNKQIVVSSDSLLDVYMDVCTRANLKFVAFLSSDSENIIDNGNTFCYLMGQVDFLEVLLDGLYSKEFLKEIKGPLDCIENISIRG